MRQPTYSGRFKRDVKRVERRGKDMAKLKAVMALSIEETPLPSNLLDHPLRGRIRFRARRIGAILHQCTVRL